MARRTHRFRHARTERRLLVYSDWDSASSQRSTSTADRPPGSRAPR